MNKILALTNTFFLSLVISLAGKSQLKWINVDSNYQPLPSSVHVFYTEDRLDTSQFKAYYVVADLDDKYIEFTTDTTLNRRLKPSEFYTKCRDQQPFLNDCQFPLVVVNCTFFSFATNRSLNVVVRNGELVAYNTHTIPGRGKDTLTYRHPLNSAIGISKKRRADVAWTFTDSSIKFPYAMQRPNEAIKDSLRQINFDYINNKTSVAVKPHNGKLSSSLKKWKVRTAVGGGPVLLQHGEVVITNNEEMKFSGKAILDKHPRTAMGYTKDGKFIILVVQGRSESASGATLEQEATILKDLGCWEALNLDGGGSSCMLVNGKETIKPSDKEGQRPVPAVFIIRQK